MNSMRLEIPFLAAVFLFGTGLLARVAVQGIEQALLSTSIEWSMKRIKLVWRKCFSRSARTGR